jgi:RNA polymerase sigma factor (sigma-70 family)
VAFADPVSDALEDVLARFALLVRSVAWRHGLDAADLDEVIQEVRYRIWRAQSDSIAISAAGASYVYRTAVSAVLDLLRGRQRAEGARFQRLDARRRSSGGALVRSSARPGGERSPADFLDASELERALESALARIPTTREPVVRMYLTGHSLHEIASEMEWSPSKTRSLLYRGLAGVRADLTAWGYGPTGTA